VNPQENINILNDLCCHENQVIMEEGDARSRWCIFFLWH